MKNEQEGKEKLKIVRSVSYYGDKRSKTSRRGKRKGQGKFENDLS